MADKPELLIKSEKIEVKVDLTHRVTALRFWDASGKSAEAWLSGPSIFVLQNELQRMLEANPEMETWRPGFRPN